MHSISRLFKIIIALIFLQLSVHAKAQKTIWDQMPSTPDELYKYFKKMDSRGVFKDFENMRGTRLIFACVNAEIFYLFSIQDDALNGETEVDKLINERCAQVDENFSDAFKKIKIPLGTPVLIKYDKDYSASEGYGKSIADWKFVASNKRSQLYLYNGKSGVNNSGNKMIWILSNNDKTSEVASIVSLREFDCKQRIFRILKGIGFKEKYGLGEKLGASDKASEWITPEPNSLFEATVDAVCK